MDQQKEKMPNKVHLSDMLARIKHTKYTKLDDGKTTICTVAMVNGYTVIGMSSCVDPAQYNEALGEKYSFEDAINKLWPLEGYLLAERRYQSDLK